MSKFITSFTNHTDYQQSIFDYTNTPNVSLCISENEVHYNPYIPLPKPKLLDILYSDANGNLSFTSEVLPVSEGKTPIGLCIASEGFFGDNEKARWMSLKYMNYTTPETGSLLSQSICWGNYSTDINTIDNITITHNNGSSYWGSINTDYNQNSSLPNILNENNEWNISVLGTINMFGMTDINGKYKTSKILEIATAQTNWQIDTSINNQSDAGYYPTACCCWKYHTLGTQQGDWYLGAVGEMCMILIEKTNINAKLSAINALYSNDCINSLNDNTYWTSTEYNSTSAWKIICNNANIGIASKDYTYNMITVALLQY